MSTENRCKLFSWENLHQSTFYQGILQVFLAIIISCWFPVNLERQKAINAERSDYINKKEEIYTRYAASLSFTLNLNDEMRGCYKVVSCETDKYYEDRCKEIISKGGFAFATMKDPIDVISSLASLYYSKSVESRIDDINKKVSALANSRLTRCDEKDDEYNKLYNSIVEVDYPAVMLLMRNELRDTRKAEQGDSQ